MLYFANVIIEELSAYSTSGYILSGGKIVFFMFNSLL